MTCSPSTHVRALLSIITGLWLAGLPVLGWAHTFYVSPTGADESSCAEATLLESPKRTIAAAMKCLTHAGETIALREGIYPEPLSWTTADHPFPSGLSWDDPIMIQAYQDELVVLHPGQGTAGIYVADPEIKFIHVKGLHIDATGLDTGVYVQSSHHVRLSNLTISGATGVGVHVLTPRSSVPNAPQVWLDGLEIHHNGKAGVVVEGAGVVLKDSQIHENHGGGLIVNGSSVNQVLSPLRIWNNRIWGNGTPEQGWGIHVTGGVPTILYGNVVNRQAQGIRLSGQGTIKHLVVHNTLVGPGHEGLSVTELLEGVRILNNICVGYERNWAVEESINNEVSRNIHERPGFVDAVQGDLHLRLDSSAVDAGLVVHELLAYVDDQDLRDVEGHPRPMGLGWDIGAFEREPGPVAPPQAAFLATPLSGVPPLPVTFLDQSTGRIDQWQWDFGDGTSSVQQHPTHEYLRSGTYRVQLRVSGPGGSDLTQQTQTVMILLAPLQAAFSAAPTIGQAPLTVQLTNQSLGDALGWRWEFGDDTTATDRHPVHRYQQPGVYRIQLQALGMNGLTVMAPSTKSIVVVPAVGATLLQENFSREDLEDWIVQDDGQWQGPSQWRVKGGGLYQLSNIWSPPAHGPGLSQLGTMLWYQPGLDWEHYRLSVRVRSDDDDAFGVVVRYQNPDNYYRFSWDCERGVRRLVKRVNGTFHTLAEEAVPYTSHESYDLTIEVFGQVLLVKINGETVLGGPIVDASLASGSVGLFTWLNNQSRFSRVEVNALTMALESSAFGKGGAR